MIRQQGTLVSVVRGTAGTALDGNRYLAAPWTTVATNVAVNIQDPTAERLAAVFGTDFPVTAVGYAAADAVTEADRLVVTAGPFLGEQFEVTRRIRHRQGSPHDHDELALVTTSEVFA